MVYGDWDLAGFLHFFANGSQRTVNTCVVADDPLAGALPHANRVAITLLPACAPFENVKAKFCLAARGHNGLMSVTSTMNWQRLNHSVAVFPPKRHILNAAYQPP